jgi:hypothetical protein
VFGHDFGFRKASRMREDLLARRHEVRLLSELPGIIIHARTSVVKLVPIAADIVILVEGNQRVDVPLHAAGKVTSAILRLQTVHDCVCCHSSGEQNNSLLSERSLMAR